MTEQEWKDEVFKAWLANDHKRTQELRDMVDDFPKHGHVIQRCALLQGHAAKHMFVDTTLKPRLGECPEWREVPVRNYHEGLIKRNPQATAEEDQL